MAERLAELIEARFRLPQERVKIVIQRTLIVLAAAGFVLVASFIVAFDRIFISLSNTADLEVGDVARADIVVPQNPPPYFSEVLTRRAEDDARAAVQPIFTPPDPSIARNQTLLAQQILDYIDNVRADTYGTPAQRIADLNAISAISFEEGIPETLLDLSADAWIEVKSEVQNVLSRVMRDEIQEAQLQRTRALLSNQVSTRATQQQSDVIVAIVEDLVQVNTFQDVESTNAERERAAAQVQDQTRQLSGGQIIVRAGDTLDELDIEALEKLNLLRSDDSRTLDVLRAVLASLLSLVIIGLYLSRFAPHLLYGSTRMLALLAGIFLLMLLAMRAVGISNVLIFPSAALAFIYVAIAGPHVAIIGSLTFAFLAAIMTNDSLLVMILFAAAGLLGTTILRRTERINAFFGPGMLVGLTNIAIVVIFNLAGASVPDTTTFLQQAIFAFLSGAFVAPVTALTIIYLATMLFNLPTALKLDDLSRSNKALLQRLLREAPGTYQHSLQVANLAEQAANAIGGDAYLTRVAALYHDIGKMLNPLFFTENQRNIGNPHDTLNDPYRSADIIIGHVTEGDELARQYRLPNRLRDFIREHHGTSEVYVFYQKALQTVDGDADAVDISDFSYPGPRPRSKETAILMLADSCEAAVRSIEPGSKAEIAALVAKIIDSRRSSGQLDESGLTLNDLRAIQDIFVDILQSMFHPRINYKEALSKSTTLPAPAPPPTTASTSTPREVPPVVAQPQKDETQPLPPITALEDAPTPEKTPPKPTPAITQVTEVIEDEEPMSEVPRLPSVDERRTTGTYRTVPVENGSAENSSTDNGKSTNGNQPRPTPENQQKSDDA